jgi:hypothetical protein
VSALSEICSPSHHGPGPMLLIAVLDLSHRRGTVHQIRPPNGLARSEARYQPKGLFSVFAQICWVYLSACTCLDHRGASAPAPSATP